MSRRHTFLALIATTLLAWPSTASSSPKPDAAETATMTDPWEVLACMYGQSRYSLPALVEGEESGRHPMGWFFWVLRQGSTIVLVDSGFTDEDKAEDWGIKNFRTATEILAELDVEPGDVTHLVLTHAHWDHLGGAGQFESATVWIRETEFNWIDDSVAEKRRSHAGLRRADLKHLLRAQDEGRLTLIGEGTVEILPGLTAYENGGHTRGSQWLTVDIGEDLVVLASDNAYLYRNIEEPVAVGTAYSKRLNLAALQAMRDTATDPALIVPGHDPAVLERFPQLIPGVVRIAPHDGT